MFFVLAVLIVVPGPGEAQLRVDHPRPLLDAIRILEDRYGWTTNYEDPPYTNPADIVEHAPTFTGSRRKIIEPRSGRIEIAYPVQPATGKPESQAAILQMILDDHTRRDNAGRFRIRLAGDMNCIVPAQGSVLDVPISLTARKTSFEEVVREVSDMVAQATGLRFRKAVVTSANPARFSFAAANEPAWSVLLRLFREAGGRFCWSVLYVPESGAFELNVREVTRQNP